MIKMRRISKQYYLRQIVACWLACYMLLGIPVQVAMAEVVMSSYPAGTITVTPLGAGTTQDMTATHGAIGNFSDFDIATGHTVNCVQPDVTSQALFKVNSGDGTQIYGTFNATGSIMLIDTAGILIGPGATINIPHLIASSLNITDPDFTSGLTTGSFQFTDGVGAGNVTNEGTINARTVALIGKNVINKGYIFASESVIMAAGDTVTISEVGSAVAVEVTMGADWAPDAYSVYQVKNEGSGGINAHQHVIFAAGDIWSNAYINAIGYGSKSVTMKAKGDIEIGGKINVYAKAAGSEAVATIDIDAAGDVMVTDEVVAEAVSHSEGSAAAKVTVNSGGDVDVIGDDGKALIQAFTSWGATNTSEILICADGRLRVNAEGVWYDDFDWPYAGSASIEAIAQSGVGMAQKNTAVVQIGAKEGIEVTASGDEWLAVISKASASIVAYAYRGVENTASVLACSNGDIKVTSGIAGEAEIRSEAGTKLANILQASASDATTTVISHAGDVLVDSSLGGGASIESVVVYGGPTATATTQIYATDVEVTGEGASIMAGVFLSRGDGDDFIFNAATDSRIEEPYGNDTLIIDSSDNADVDCPDCPRDDEELLAPVAPLAQFQIPRIEGCPVLMEAVALELGITEETLQVAIGNALALNPSMQPCEACATLVNAAAVLRDEDGSRMAAMVQAFNALAPADAPFTPEMATSIAMAFGGAAEGTQYASAMEYIDAFVQYVAVLDTELGSPVGDSVAFVMEKYGAGITGSDNGNITAFVATRLETIGE